MRIPGDGDQRFRKIVIAIPNDRDRDSGMIVIGVPTEGDQGFRDDRDQLIVTPEW
jgi:hypothetical protein